MIRTEFKVIEKVNNNIDVDTLVQTCHWNFERKARHEKIQSVIGKGNVFASFVVDTAHPHGAELHTIFDNGIIVIQNNFTKCLVTELIARPNQIKRYWRGLNMAFPSELYKITDKAYHNQLNGYNQW